jgi:hypothetical protein
VAQVAAQSEQPTMKTLIRPFREARMDSGFFFFVAIMIRLWK